MMRGGSEMEFGLFGLGGYPIGKFSYADGSPLGLKPRFLRLGGGLIIVGLQDTIKTSK